MRSLTLTLALASTLSLAACKDDAATDDSTATDDSSTDDSSTDDSTAASLYEQLGGETGVNTLLDAFLGNVAADARINWFFARADLAQLKSQLHDQICAATGGGCTYSGASMVDAHAGMGITNAQFNAMVEDLLAACDSLGIPYSAALDGSETIDPLLVALVGMQTDIVTDPEGNTTYFNQIGSAYGGGNGHAAVSAVIDAMLGYVATDSRINAFFAASDLTALRNHLIDQVCEATGGYCTYTGLDMQTAHAGMCISSDDFNALVEDLLFGLDDLGVPYALDGSELIDPLLLTLAGMSTDIVEECK